MDYGFQNSLTVKLKEGTDDTWIITEPLIYWSKEFGLIEVPAGFETDFSSVPRVPIAYQLWGDRSHREGVLHDYLFKIDSKPNLPFSACNKAFLEAMKTRGVPWFIRWPMYCGVCIGGWPFYHKRKVMG